MYCDKCKHKAEIEAALQECQLCDKSCFHGGMSRASVLNGGHNCGDCPHLKEVSKALHPCEVCEAGRLAHTYALDATEHGMGLLSQTLPDVHADTSGVTTLSPEVEDALRKLLAVLFDFEPLELLLIQHIIHGRNVGTFREPLAHLRDRLNKRYDLSQESTSFRACAHEWKKAIVRKIPAIGQLFDAINDANAGGAWK